MTQFTIWDPSIGERKANLALTNNFASAVNPAVGNDSTQGYQVGSIWINTTAQTAWQCLSAAAGAAVWVEYASGGAVVSDSSAKYNASNSAVSFTATGAQVSGGSAFVELDLTGNPAGAANVTLPTVAALVAAITGVAAGDSYLLRIKNSANSNTWTVVTNTGWTLNGTMTIATTVWRDFILTFTSLSAATLQNAGGATGTL
jgi:hypothetical protein